MWDRSLEDTPLTRVSVVFHAHSDIVDVVVAIKGEGRHIRVKDGCGRIHGDGGLTRTPTLGIIDVPRRGT